MLKKIILLNLILFVFMGAYLESYVSSSIDTSQLNRGIVGVSHVSQKNKKLKVMIEKGSSKYTYNLNGAGEKEFYPLQMGNGEYKVSIMENISGTKYSYVKTEKGTLKLTDPNVVFLNSVQNVKWSLGYSSIKYGNNLSSSAKNQNQKLDILYDYVVKNYTYDYDKISSLTPDYNPNIETTFRDKGGICYDYSSLLAAMQRSQNLPTKLVKGYATGVEGYHAWNEVLINGNWVVVDTTYDAAMWGGKANYSMIKNASNYKKVNEY